MPRAKLERTGLTVKWSDDVRPRGLVKGHWRKRVQPRAPAGWYVFAEGRDGMEAVIELRFDRERDARLAASALLAAGLTSVRRMAAAGELVIKTAYEALQW